MEVLFSLVSVRSIDPYFSPDVSAVVFSVREKIYMEKLPGAYVFVYCRSACFRSLDSGASVGQQVWLVIT